MALHQDISVAKWRETSPGFYTRPFDGLGQIYKVLTDVDPMHWMMSTTVKLLIPSHINLVTAARTAWITLRYEQPSIASKVDREQGLMTYTVSTETETHAWLAETFVIVEETVSAQALRPKVPPASRPTLYVLPNTNELMFRSNHMHIDAIGCFDIMNDIIELITRPRKASFEYDGSEAKNLAPVLEDAANLPAATAAETQKAKDILTNHLANLPSIGQAFDPASKAQSSRTVTTKFGEDLTKKVLDACKKLGVTPTHAIQSAIALAVEREVRQEDGLLSYAGLMIANERPNVLDHATSQHCNLYMMGLPISVKLSGHDDFLSIMREYQKQYLANSRGGRDLEEHKEHLTIGCQFLLELSKGLTSAPPVERSANEPILSSLGVIERHIKNDYPGVSAGEQLKVDDFWFWVDTMSQQNIVYLWTFAGRMTITTCFNDGYYSKEYVDRWHRSVEEIMLEGLGLSGQGKGLEHVII